MAKQLGLFVDRCEDLGPDCPAKAVGVIEGLTARKGSIVVCTHGEVIEYLQQHLLGATGAGFGADQPRDKGSIWVLGLENRAIASARYVPPLKTR